ncbi:MAG: helix-turn-helix domain-containing protein [Bacteroidia bacterium]
MPKYSNPFVIKISFKVPKPKDIRYPKNLDTIGDHILRFRLDNNLRQKETVAQLGVSVTTLSNWERNQTTPKAMYWPKIISMLGYTPIISSYSPLKSIRMRKGLSQKKLAHLIGIDEETIIRFEAGKQCRKETNEKILQWMKLEDK